MSALQNAVVGRTGWKLRTPSTYCYRHKDLRAWVVVGTDPKTKTAAYSWWLEWTFGERIASGARTDAADALIAAETAMYAYAHSLGGAA